MFRSIGNLQDNFHLNSFSKDLFLKFKIMSKLTYGKLIKIHTGSILFNKHLNIKISLIFFKINSCRKLLRKLYPLKRVSLTFHSLKMRK